MKPNLTATCPPGAMEGKTPMRKNPVNAGMKNRVKNYPDVPSEGPPQLGEEARLRREMRTASHPTRHRRSGG